jgi:alpha-tubulin suppressor-like RCC1 family protein
LTLAVTYDSSPPIVRILSPAPNYSSASGSVDVAGTATDDLGLTGVAWRNVTANWSGPVAGLASWTATVPLVLGENLVEVTATDTFGRTSTDRLLVSVDAHVVVWGQNWQSRLGNLAVPPDGSRVPLPGPLDDGVQVTAGAVHSAVLRSDGTVLTWGGSTYPDRPIENAHVPWQVANLAGAVAVDAGGAHTLALLQDGTVKMWIHGDAAAEVAGLAGVRAVAAGEFHNVALLDDGTVREWPVANVPPADPGLSRIVAISAGDHHSVALDQDGVVWAWGSESSWPLRILAQVPDAIGLGRGGQALLRSGGRVAVWQTLEGTPVDVPGLSGVTTVEFNLGYGGLALCDDGTLWTWTSSGAPMAVSGLTGVTSAAKGYGHLIARKR